MDTVITNIVDTLSVQNIRKGIPLETWSFFLSIISLAIALLALLFSVFWNWFASWKKEITIQWTNFAADRIDLWQTLDKTYEAWTNPIKEKCSRFGILLKCASIPERLKYDLEMKEIDALIKDLEDGEPNDIKKYQGTLFKFCSEIWEEKTKLNGPLILDKFGKACSKLTWSLDGWAKMLYITPRRTFKIAFIMPLIPRHYLLKRFRSDWALLTILTYLELSLKKKINERWSDRSGLFRLAYKVNEKKPS